MLRCVFSDVSERDMDMLISEEIVSSPDFLALFLHKVGIDSASVRSVELSKTDVGLGESDITVIIEANGLKVGLLIEDKIDAIAMPDQSARYTLRGNKGVTSGDYSKFYVFIVAPSKYLSNNDEAGKYPNQISYEELLQYFKLKKDSRSCFKAQQLEQAIHKQKTGYQVIEDTAVTEFWARYSDYQKTHCPNVWLIYSGEKKGTNASWPRYNTNIKGLYFFHKSEFGYVDLTFENCADKIIELERLLKVALGDYLSKGFTVWRTGKSAAVRLNVPVLDFHASFESQQSNVERCFNEILRMSETVKQLNSDDVAELLCSSN